MSPIANHTSLSVLFTDQCIAMMTGHFIDTDRNITKNVLIFLGTLFHTDNLHYTLAIFYRPGVAGDVL